MIGLGYETYTRGEGRRGSGKLRTLGLTLRPCQVYLLSIIEPSVCVDIPACSCSSHITIDRYHFHLPSSFHLLFPLPPLLCLGQCLWQPRLSKPIWNKFGKHNHLFKSELYLCLLFVFEIGFGFGGASQSRGERLWNGFAQIISFYNMPHPVHNLHVKGPMQSGVMCVESECTISVDRIIVRSHTHHSQS